MPASTKRKSSAGETPANAYQPFGSALEIFYAKDDEVIVDGPANTGKSRAILEKLNLVAMKYPRARILVMRKTRASLTQSAVVTYENFVVPDLLTHKIVRFRATEQEYRYSNGSRIILGGLDKATRVLSTEYDIIYVQEGIEITEEEYETLVTRCRNGIVPYNQIIIDTNPGPAHHWIKRRWETGRGRRIKSVHSDNPRLYDPRTGVQTEFGRRYLGKLQNLTGSRYNRLYLGEWTSAEGLIYDNFDPDKHIVYRFKIPETWRRFLAIDFGYTNPFVCQWWAMDEDDRMFMYREIYMTQRTVREHGQLIAQLSEGEQIETAVCDHDAGDRATLEQMGIPTVPAIKTISNGIQSVLNRLKPAGDERSRIFFLRDSLVEQDEALVEAAKPRQTTDEFEDYVWGNHITKEAPIQTDNHGMDAMRYAAMYADNFSSTGGIYV